MFTRRSSASLAVINVFMFGIAGRAIISQLSAALLAARRSQPHLQREAGS